jgi:hypothetical protein
VTLDEYDIDGATVHIAFDSGGPVGSDHLVTVDGDDYRVVRWFYFDEFAEPYARNVARKVVRDEAYRAACLDGTTDWARIAERYEPAARRVFAVFEDAALVGYTAGDDDAEARYRAATESCERLCEELFDEIRRRVRAEQPLEDLDEYVDERVARARTRAAELTD